MKEKAVSELRRTIDQLAVAKQGVVDRARLKHLNAQRDALDALPGAAVIDAVRTQRNGLSRDIAALEQVVATRESAAADEAAFFDARENDMPVDVAAYTTRVQAFADQLAALAPVAAALDADGKAIADRYGRWEGDEQRGVPEVVTLVCDPNEGLNAAFTAPRSLLVRWQTRVSARGKEHHGLEVVPPGKRAA